MDPEFRERVLSAKGLLYMHLLYENAHSVGTEDGLGYAIYMQSIVKEESVKS